MGQLGYALTGGLQGYGQGLQNQYEHQDRLRKQQREDADLKLRQGSEDRAGKAQRLQAAQAMLADANAEMQRSDWDARPDKERSVVQARADKARAAIAAAGGLVDEVPPPAPAEDTSISPAAPPAGIGQFRGGLNSQNALGNMQLQTPQASQDGPSQPPANFDTGGTPQNPWSGASPSKKAEVEYMGQDLHNAIVNPLDNPQPGVTDGSITAPHGMITPQQVSSLMQETSPGFQMPQVPQAPASQAPQHPAATQQTAPTDITSHFMQQVQPMFEKLLPAIANLAQHGNYEGVAKAITSIQAITLQQAQIYAANLANKAQEIGLPYIAPEAQAKIASELAQAAQSNAMAAIGIPAEAQYHLQAGKAAMLGATAKDTMAPLNLRLKIAEITNQANATAATIAHQANEDAATRARDAQNNIHNTNQDTLGLEGLRQRGEIHGSDQAERDKARVEAPLIAGLIKELVPTDRITGQTKPQKDWTSKFSVRLQDARRKLGYAPDPAKVVPPGISPSLWGAVIQDGFNPNTAIEALRHSRDPNAQAALPQIKKAYAIWQRIKPQFQ